jgi:DNA invertase Pin-like site-specific DNA recombinase
MSLSPSASRTPLQVAYASQFESAPNGGVDKDSEKRQRAAIEGYAKRSGFEIVDSYYDAAVSGADPIQTRPGFAALLDRIEGNGVRTVIVEDASRFARELMAQELGITLLLSRGVRLLTATGDDLTASDEPSRKMMRQIAGSFAEYEKARLVAKLKAARDRKRATGEKVEGHKAHGELRPDVVALAKRLRRASPKGGRLSYRDIAQRLADAGHLVARAAPGPDRDRQRISLNRIRAVASASTARAATAIWVPRLVPPAPRSSSRWIWREPSMLILATRTVA